MSPNLPQIMYRDRGKGGSKCASAMCISLVAAECDRIYRTQCEYNMRVAANSPGILDLAVYIYFDVGRALVIVLDIL